MMLREQLEIIRTHQSSVPIEVVPIAQALGLEVFRVDDWPENLSGAIISDGESGYAIYVNSQHSAVRRRFTIAHEIAHFVLHKDLIGDGIQDDGLYRSGLSNRIEAQANALAADILMPRALIRRYADENGIDRDDVVRLAKAFNVSKDAMSIRLLGVQYSQAA